MDVIALGEILIDFTESGVSETGMKLFEQNPGGAPANVLVALAKWGKKTGFVGKVGSDMHGLFLKRVLMQNNVDVSQLIVDDDVFTTLAFVELNEKGERKFSFARKPGADTCIKRDEVSREYIESAKIFHFGSLSLTDEPSRGATLKALEMAEKAGKIISYDPNYRPLLWKSRDQAIENMRSVLGYVDVMKISEEETELLTGKKEPAEAAKILVEKGISMVAVTLGAEGTLICTKKGSVVAGGFQTSVVDTTGAGDSFWAGFLYKLLESEKDPDQISLDELKTFGRFGNAVASLCIEKRGAIPAMPSLERVNQRAAEPFSLTFV